ncbi:MAG: hypothetical protein U0528_13830 [Anaerolineae bacterium]
MLARITIDEVGNCYAAQYLVFFSQMSQEIRQASTRFQPSKRWKLPHAHRLGAIRGLILERASPNSDRRLTPAQITLSRLRDEGRG